MELEKPSLQNLEIEKSPLKLEKSSKKEIQDTIIPQSISIKSTEEEFFNILKMAAPGTNLRTAIDNALKAGKGALIVVENESVLPLIDGGFRVYCRFTPQRLAELTKMDGAIILSDDIKRINYANVILTPSSKIKTTETGARHKAAERTAKQTGTLVIAISERKNEITIFYKNIKYHLKRTDEVLRKANAHIQMLEKQRELFDENIEKLDNLELKNYPSLHQAVTVIQKGKLIQKIASDLKKYIIELGNEGTLLKTRLKEIITDVDRETNLVIKDYTKLDLKKSRVMLDSLLYDEILDHDNITKALAYETPIQTSSIKGWRILSKTSLQEQEIASLVKQLCTLGNAIHSNLSIYTHILGEDKAKAFKYEIERIKLNV